MRHIHVLLVSAIFSSLFAAQTASAAPLAYEGFDYPVTPPFQLLGSNGGSGFSSPWSAGGFNASLNTNYLVEPGSLPYPGLDTSGGYITTEEVNQIAGITRNLGQPIGTPGTTRYLSFLMRPEGAVGAGAFNGFFGLLTEAAGEPEIFFGKPGGGDLTHFAIEERGGGLQVATPQEVIAGPTNLIVIKAEFTAGNDIFTVYMNPTVGAPEPASGIVKSDSNLGLATGLTLYSTGAFSIDEIRLGETFADVTPAAVPEPTTLTLAASIGIVALTCLRRRRAAR